MCADNKPKWQEEIEKILREKFQGAELAEQLKIAEELVESIREVKVPRGIAGQVVSDILDRASEVLRPLAATYAGFQLGVAYERYQNANRA